MTSTNTRLLALAAAAAMLVGCGRSVSPMAARQVASATTAQSVAASLLKDDPDHQQMNAIVKGVLDGMYASLLQTADTNHDGAVSRDEYAKNHTNDASWLFQATFDENRDGVITQAEYDKAMASGQPVELYHKFTEDQMEKAIAPYVADKKFTAQEIRTYMTTDLGLTGDWPQIFKIMSKLDLNKDGSVLSGPGEGSAFLLFFAQAQMQHALSLPVSPLPY